MLNCLAIGDPLVTAKDFDAALNSTDLFKSYRSIQWTPCESRAEFRQVIRRLETEGPFAFDPADSLAESIGDIDVLFIDHHPVSSALLKSADKLKYIVSARGGTENIDLDASKEKGITVIYCPVHNAVAVAEYTLGLMLCELRNIARADAGIREGRWIEAFPNSDCIGELSDAVIGLIGFGTIGRLVAERLLSFGSEILVYDPYVGGKEIEQAGAHAVCLDELLGKSDIVSLHVRDSSGRPMIGGRELAIMKPSAYLINTARASLLDLDALYIALKEKKIMGAALDVFETEPLPASYPLINLGNVTLTNHRAGDTCNALKKAPEILLKQFTELLTTGKTRYMIR